MAPRTSLWTARVRSVPTKSAFSSGPSHSQPPAKTGLDDGVNGLGIADLLFDQGDRFAPQGVLQAVADEAGDIPLDVYGRFANRRVQRNGSVDNVGRGPLSFDHFN